MMNRLYPPRVFVLLATQRQSITEMTAPALVIMPALIAFSVIATMKDLRARPLSILGGLEVARRENSPSRFSPLQV
jgi:hypothetical protein